MSNEQQNDTLSLHNMLQAFVQDHIKERSHAEKNVKKIKKQFGEVEAYENDRQEQIEAVKDFFEKRTKAISALQENFNQAKNREADISEKYENAIKKCVQQEVEHDKAMAELMERIQELEAGKTNIDAIIMAKEAECAAYLNDMKTKVEKFTELENQWKDEKNMLREKVADMEAKLQENKEGAAVAMNQKTEQLIKKEKRLKKLKEKLDKFKADNDELQKKLQIQARKMDELQSVLNRPAQFLAPAKEGISTSELQAEVKPMIPVTQPIQNSKPSISPNIIEITPASNHDSETGDSRILRPRSQRPTYQDNDNLSNDEIIEPSSDSSPIREVRTLTTFAQIHNENVSTVQPKAKTPAKRQLSDLSDDFFPPYQPQAANKSFNISQKSFKRSKF